MYFLSKKIHIKNVIRIVVIPQGIMSIIGYADCGRTYSIKRYKHANQNARFSALNVWYMLFIRSEYNSNIVLIVGVSKCALFRRHCYMHFSSIAQAVIHISAHNYPACAVSRMFVLHASRLFLTIFFECLDCGSVCR